MALYMHPGSIPRCPPAPDSILNHNNHLHTGFDRSDANLEHCFPHLFHTAASLPGTWHLLPALQYLISPSSRQARLSIIPTSSNPKATIRPLLTGAQLNQHTIQFVTRESTTRRESLLSSASIASIPQSEQYYIEPIIAPS